MDIGSLLSAVVDEVDRLEELLVQYRPMLREADQLILSQLHPPMQNTGAALMSLQRAAAQLRAAVPAEPAAAGPPASPAMAL